MEEQINKLRHYSYTILSIAIATSIIVIFFAPIDTAIILIVLTWLSTAIIMGWIGYKIRNLRNEQFRIQQVYVAPPTYPQQIYHEPMQPVYQSQQVYHDSSTPPVYQEPMQPVYHKN